MALSAAGIETLNDKFEPVIVAPVTYEYQESSFETTPVTYEYQESAGWDLLASEPWWFATTFLLPFNSDFADISMNLMGAMTENGTPTIDAATKKFGAGSASFDGSTDWLEVPDNAGLDLPGAFTLSAWVNLNPKSWQTLLEIGQFNSGGGMLVRLGGGEGATEVYTASASFGGGSLPSGQWVHFMLTRDSSNIMRMFSDGVRIAQSGVIADSIATTIGARIGRAKHNNADWLSGNIDDMLLVKGVCLFTDEFKIPDAELSSAFQFGDLPAYQNNGGTGNRSSLGITVSTDLSVAGPIANLLDGVFANDFYFVSTGDVTGRYIQVDFGKDAYVDQWRLRNAGGQSLGNWQPQYSDNGADWTNCGSVQAIGGASSTTRLNFDIAAAHRYYRLLGASGEISQTYNHELEFRIKPGF